MVALEDLETELLNMLAKVSRVGAEPVDETRITAKKCEGLDGRSNNRGRKGIGKNIRPGFLTQICNEILFAGYVPAGGSTHGLAKRSAKHVDLSMYAELFGATTSGTATCTDAVRVINK